ncbi:phosphotransferase, partial [Rhizobiaceae sp. 2RAB30]
YDQLPETARNLLGRRLGQFYAELHELDQDAVKAAGPGPVEAWLNAEEILRKAVPALPGALRSFAEDTVAEWQDMPADPYGTTYGFFDGHGWNMAFDHDSGTLSGVYDFADSGFGALHQEFIYSNFISPDLTWRIVDSYEAASGRRLDRRRIEVLTGVHRLSELAALADDPVHLPDMIRHVAAWAKP